MILRVGGLCILLQLVVAGSYMLGLIPTGGSVPQEPGMDWEKWRSLEQATADEGPDGAVVTAGVFIL